MRLLNAGICAGCKRKLDGEKKSLLSCALLLPVFGGVWVCESVVVCTWTWQCFRESVASPSAVAEQARVSL